MCGDYREVQKGPNQPEVVIDFEFEFELRSRKDARRNATKNDHRRDS